jgi:hypothetical protein
MENINKPIRKKLPSKKLLTKGNKSLFTEYLKVNTYNPITFVLAFTSAFLHAMMRSNISARWAEGTMRADIALVFVSFFFWLSFMLNVQRMVYGTRIDQIIFLISATIGTIAGVSIFS